MKIFYFTPMLIFIISCTNAINIEDQNWSINEDFIREGCFSGKDCIPSIDSPKFSPIDGKDIDFLDENDFVVGIWHEGNYLAFPHSILDWHEIINGPGYSISYCPLTGSAINIETNYEFGVSGLLYNSNLIMYDRKTDSLWPQMLIKSASGKRIDEFLKISPLIETTWSNWKKLFPNSKVLNSNTGHNRNYDDYPYGDYKTCNTPNCSDYIYFPIEYEDDRLPPKERILTIINDGTAKAVRIKSTSPKIFNIDVNDISYTIIVSETDDIAISFNTTRELVIQKWDISTGEIIISDKNSTEKWDILGVNISNPGINNLEIADSYVAYWFSISAFFPDIEIIN